MNRYLLLILAVFSLSAVAAPPDSQHGHGKQIIPERPSTDYVHIPPVVPPDLPSVNLPNSTTVWQHGETSISVEWDGLDGRLVMIELYRGDELAAELSNWIDNVSMYTRSAPVPESWSSGIDYRIRIIDNNQHEIWSDAFQIASEFMIEEPGSGAVYVYGEYLGEVSWSGGGGGTVEIDLYKGGAFVTHLYQGISTNQHVVLSNEVSSSWGEGNDFRIKVTDPQTGFGWSSPFSVHAMDIESPQAGTVVSTGEEFPRITWRGGANLVKLTLYRGDTSVYELTDWIENSGEFVAGIRIPADWSAGSDYRILLEDDLENVISSTNFAIYWSDNAINGAHRILGDSITDVIGCDDDIDHYVLNMESNYIYTISVSPSIAHIALLESTGDVIINSDNGQLVYNCTRSGERYVRVTAYSSDMHPYTVLVRREYGRFRTPVMGLGFGIMYINTTNDIASKDAGWGLQLSIAPAERVAIGYLVTPVFEDSDSAIGIHDIYAGYKLISSRGYMDANSTVYEIALGLTYTHITGSEWFQENYSDVYQYYNEEYTGVAGAIRAKIALHEVNSPGDIGLNIVLLTSMRIAAYIQWEFYD